MIDEKILRITFGISGRDPRPAQMRAKGAKLPSNNMLSDFWRQF